MDNDGMFKAETQRDIRIASFVNETEKANIVAAARASGMSLSTFIRVKLLEASRERSD